MGWTSTHRPAGMTTLDFFRGEFPNLFTEHDVVAHNSDREGFYAAMRDRGTGEVWALVVAVQRTPSAHFNYTYKEMQDSMGPGYYGASRAVLDALTPTESQWANEWRAQVRARLDRRVPKVGDVVRFTHPFEFQDGKERDTFRLTQRQKWTRGGMRNETVAVAVLDGVTCKLPTGWAKGVGYEVLDAATIGTVA